MTSRWGQVQKQKVSKEDSKWSKWPQLRKAHAFIFTCWASNWIFTRKIKDCMWRRGGEKQRMTTVFRWLWSLPPIQFHLHGRYPGPDVESCLTHKTPDTLLFCAASGARTMKSSEYIMPCFLGLKSNHHHGSEHVVLSQLLCQKLMCLCSHSYPHV